MGQQYLLVPELYFCVCCISCGTQVYVQVNREAAHNEELRRAAADFFRQLEQHEHQAVSLWQQFRDITVEEYQRVYKVDVRANFSSHKMSKIRA